MLVGSAGLSGSVAESFLNVQVTTGVPYFDAVNTTVPAGCSALPSSFQSSGMSTIFTWVPAGMVHVPVFVGSNPWTGLPSAVAVTFFSSAAYAPASGRPDPSSYANAHSSNRYMKSVNMLGREHLARFGFRLVMVELVEEDAHDRKPMETSPIQPLRGREHKDKRQHRISSAVQCAAAENELEESRPSKWAWTKLALADSSARHRSDWTVSPTVLSMRTVSPLSLNLS